MIPIIGRIIVGTIICTIIGTIKSSDNAGNAENAENHKNMQKIIRHAENSENHKKIIGTKQNK